MAAPDPRDPGGITAVMDSWLESGLGEAVDLVELPTSAMNSPLPAKLGQAGAAAMRLARLLATRPRPDVVHLHASTGGSLFRKLGLARLCRAARVPYVAHEHSGELEAWIGESSRRRAAARSLYGGAAASIVLAERWRPLMSTLGAERIEVLPNGLSPAARERLAGAAAERRRPGRLLSHGRWVPKKGLDRLAAALRELERSDYELWIFGSGERQATLDLFAGVAGRVEVAGWLGDEAKATELGRAEALVAPSRAEGLPVALIEARAAGAAVIASDVGGVAEALRDYPQGQALAAGDDRALAAAIASLLDGDWPAARAAPGLPPQLRSEVAVERLVALYEDVAASR